MPFAERRLTNPTTLSTVASTVYTVPSQYTTIVKQVVVTNTTASPASFNLYIGSATSANAIFSNTTISANDSLIINLSQVLSSLEILTASANANSAVNMTISGVENNGPLDPANVYIADGAITTSKLANSSVTSTKIAANAVTNTAILDDAVSTAKIANSAITTDKIAANAVVTADIANNAVTQAKLDTAVPLSGMRNRVINGGFDIWQRSLDATTLGADQYSGPDRWRTRTANAGGSLRISRQLSGLAGTTYCARVQRTAGTNNTGSLQIVHTLESINSIPMAGQPLTFSFWARRGPDYSPTSSLMVVSLVSGTGTDQYWLSFTNGVALLDTTVSLTASWQRFTFTVTPAANASQFYIKFEMNPTGTAQTNDYFEVTGVQLESGSQATPFEQRQVGTELSLCQRYYFRFENFGLYTQFFNGSATSTSNVRVQVQFPVRMRIAPSTTLDTSATNTFRIVDGVGAANPTAISMALAHGGPHTAGVDFSAGAVFVQYRPYWVDSSNQPSGNCYIGFSAEL